MGIISSIFKFIHSDKSKPRKEALYKVTIKGMAVKIGGGGSIRIHDEVIMTHKQVSPFRGGKSKIPAINAWIAANYPGYQAQKASSFGINIDYHKDEQRNRLKGDKIM